VVLDAKADHEVAFAMDMYSLCKQFKVLPRAGGLLDQDYYHIVLLRGVTRAVAIREERERNKTKPPGR